MKLLRSFAAAALIIVLTAGCGGRTPSSVLTFYEESGGSLIEESSAISSASSENTEENFTDEMTNSAEDHAVSAEEAHTAPEASEMNILSSEENGFRFGLLTAEEKNLYVELFSHIRNRESVIKVYASDNIEIRNALRAVIDDHPEFFWLSGSASIYGYEGAGEKEITLEFSMEEEAIESTEQAINEAAAEYLDSLPENASDYEKVLKAYEYVILNTDYKVNCYQGQNIVSALIFHESVCAGYAKAFKFLLDRAGVWCAYMTGKVTRGGVTESHAWNMVTIDGENYFADPTWGDPTYDESLDYDVRPEITYDYFCITTSDMVRTLHEPDDYYEFPDCSSRKYDYYVLNGWYHETYDESLIRGRMQEAIDNNINEIHFKFGSFEAYAQAEAGIFDGGILYDALQQRMRWDMTDSITYSPIKSDGLCTIDIYW